MAGMQKLKSFLAPAAVVAIAFTGSEFLVRLVLLLSSAGNVKSNLLGVLAAFLIGFVYDLATISWVLLPLVALGACMPARWLHSRAYAWLADWFAFCFCFFVLMNSVC